LKLSFYTNLNILINNLFKIKKTMKHLFKTLLFVAITAATIVTLSSFLKKKAASAIDSYQIVLVSKTTTGSNTEWIWSVTNPNPGNGDNGTLQNVSHWSMPLNLAAEAALQSAEYSYDGVTWASANAVVERDPSIRLCTTVDVLKFDRGTTGTAPLYCRAVFNQDFPVNPYATSWIKTGGGLQGCNMYFFSGLGASNN
jgi:hypothetical protein